MADKPDMRKMIMSLRSPEIQKILGLLKLSRYGKKLELMQRILDASSHGLPKPVQNEIEALYRQRYSMVAYAPKPTQMVSKIPDPDYTSLDAYKDYGVPGVLVPQVTSQLPIHPDVKLKPLPFYDQVAPLLKPSTLVPRMSSVCQEAVFAFHLTPQQANLIAIKNCEGGPEVAQLQLRFCWLETSCEQDDHFPPNLMVRVNNRIVQLPNPLPSNKQGVEPKRPPQPLNITSLCRINAVNKNQVVVTWASEYGRNYCTSVNLVLALNSNILLTRLKQNGIRHPFHTRGLIKEKLALDVDSEIATTSLRISLLCPLGKMRMTVPCRATTCNHLQCFDAPTFLQMNEKKPTWLCPVCDKPAEFQSLIIDGLFTEILQKASKAIEIQFTEDGEWQPMNSKEDECWIRDSPAVEEAMPETSNSGESDFIDLTETDEDDDEEVDDRTDHSLSATPHVALACSPSYASIVSAGSVRTISSQDRDSPIVISIDSPPRRSMNTPDSFYVCDYNQPAGMGVTLPKPPPAHSKIPVSSYASSINPNYPPTGAGSPHLRSIMYSQGVPTEFDYSSALPLNALRQPAHSNSQSKSHLAMFP